MVIHEPQRGAIRHWMLQRASALGMVFVTTLAAIALVAEQPMSSYEEWRAFTNNTWVEIAILVYAVCMVNHAYIGTNDVLLDYVRTPRLRLYFQVVVVAILAVFLIRVVRAL